MVSFSVNPPCLPPPVPGVKNGFEAVMISSSILGDIKYLKGSSFSCKYQYPGILPYIPSLPTGDAEGRNTLSKWLKNVEQQYGRVANSNYQYTLMDSAKGNQVMMQGS